MNENQSAAQRAIAQVIVFKYAWIFGTVAIVAMLVAWSLVVTYRNGITAGEDHGYISGLSAGYDQGNAAGQDSGYRSGLELGLAQIVTERDRISADLVAEIKAEGAIDGRREIWDGLWQSIAASGTVRLVQGDNEVTMVSLERLQEAAATPTTIEDAATPVPAP